MHEGGKKPEIVKSRMDGVSISSRNGSILSVAFGNAPRRKRNWRIVRCGGRLNGLGRGIGEGSRFGEKVAWGAIQRFGELEKGFDGDVLDSALDQADVVAVQVQSFRKLLLRKAEGFSPVPDGLTEVPTEFCHGRMSFHCVHFGHFPAEIHPL